jgi:hypothetical protein
MQHKPSKVEQREAAAGGIPTGVVRSIFLLCILLKGHGLDDRLQVGREKGRERALPARKGSVSEQGKVANNLIMELAHRNLVHRKTMDQRL